MSAFPAETPVALEAPLQRLLAALLAGAETGQVVAGGIGCSPDVPVLSAVRSPLLLAGFQFWRPGLLHIEVRRIYIAPTLQHRLAQGNGASCCQRARADCVDSEDSDIGLLAEAARPWFTGSMLILLRLAQEPCSLPLLPRCTFKCTKFIQGAALAAACGLFARVLLAPGSPDLALAFFRRAPPPPPAASASLPNGGGQAQTLAGLQVPNGVPGGSGGDAALLAFADLWLDRCDTAVQALSQLGRVACGKASGNWSNAVRTIFSLLYAHSPLFGGVVSGCPGTQKLLECELLAGPCGLAGLATPAAC